MGRHASWLTAVLIGASWAALVPGTLAQAAEQPLLEILDGTGDAWRQEAEGQGDLSHPLPANGFMDAFDIVSFRVEDERAQTIDLVIQVRDLDAALRTSDPQGSYRYFVRFQLENVPVRYEAFVLSDGQLPEGSGPHAAPAALCIYASTDDDYNMFRCRAQSVWGWLEPDEDIVRIRLPKMALMGQMPPLEESVPGLPRTLASGTILSQWQAIGARKDDGNSYSSSNRERFVDPAPDEAPSAETVELQFAAPNSVVAFSGNVGAPSRGFGSVYFGGMPTPDEVRKTTVTVPGQAWPLTLTLANAAPSKRLLNISAAAEPTSPPWTFEVPSVVEIPGGSSRAFSLLVNASAVAEHRDEFTVHIDARSIGHPDEYASIDARVVAVRAPTAAQPRLYLHHANHETNTLTVGQTTVCVLGVDCSYDSGIWMNTLAQDPLENLDYVAGFSPLLPVDSGIMFRAIFETDTALPAAPLLAADAAVQVHLEFQAAMDLDASINVRLEGSQGQGGCTGCTDWLALGTTNALVGVGTDATPVDLDVPLNPLVLNDVDPQPRYRLVVEASTDQWLEANLGRDFRLLLPASHLTLPIVDELELAGAPSLIRTYIVGDAEEFVNPGETRIKRVVVANEGVKEARVAVTATTPSADWGLDLRPASRYRLEAGQAVNVTLLVSAPADVAEGTRADVTVRATPLDDTRSGNQVTFTFTATQGVDLPDESQSFADDEEAAAFVLDDPPQADSPAPALAWVAAGVAMAALVRRRSRR